MRGRHLVALLGLAAVAALAMFSQADALQSNRAYKYVVLTVVITPSPAPVGFLKPATHGAAIADAGGGVRPPATGALAFVATAPSASVAQLAADPFATPVQLASAGTAWDVAPGLAPFELAQAQAQPTPVPVQFVAKADPNAQYIHTIPHTGELDAGYGSNTYTCAFEIYTYYTTAYTLTDWGYGTTKSGSGTYPVLNYPSTSDLAWQVPDLSSTVHAYSNSGSPGETTWTGTAGEKQQHCFNLTLTVPATEPAGTYTATIQYNLMTN
ncbi:MAG TPA: hypothetical protein VFB22_15015 [Candidatus Baltobacteraceae bacterium]|nr:hypothetical protein [Candidatus Baltobacteraceae bacterium]